MPDITISSAGMDDVREVGRRRGSDETTLRVALELADRGTAWVARDEGEAIGLAIAHASDDEWYVGTVFVEASYRGQGIGSQLLDAALREAGDRMRALALDPSDPAALGLALRHGMAPQGTILRMGGAIPREEALASMAAGNYRFQVGAIDPLAHRFALDALDREVRGSTRFDDHARFVREASGHAFFLGGEFVAYAYVWPDGRIGPIAAASGAYLVQVLTFAFLTLARGGASWCTALIPASNLRLSRAALLAGLKIEDSFAFASDGAGGDLARYAGYHPLLF